MFPALPRILGCSCTECGSGFLPWSDANDGIIVVGMLVVEIESQVCAWLSPESENCSVFADYAILITGGEVKHIVKQLVAKAEANADPEMFRGVSGEIDLISLPVLVE